MSKLRSSLGGSGIQKGNTQYAHILSNNGCPIIFKPPLKPQISHNTPFQKAIQSYQTEGQLVAYNITSKLTTNLMTCSNSVVAQLGCCCFIPLSQKKLTMLQFFADDDLSGKFCVLSVVVRVSLAPIRTKLGLVCE